MSWHYRWWSELTVDELYAIMVVRQRVFSVEQDCAYLDADGLDPRSHHLWQPSSDGVAAYLRVLAPGVKYDEASLGRIVTAPEVRGTGLGRALVGEGVARIEAAHGRVAIRIGAQRYLERFYGEFGFARASDDYLEDGIVHLEMIRPAA